jgi:hypothetical protein
MMALMEDGETRCDQINKQMKRYDVMAGGGKLIGSGAIGGLWRFDESKRCDVIKVETQPCESHPIPCKKQKQKPCAIWRGNRRLLDWR